MRVPAVRRRERPALRAPQRPGPLGWVGLAEAAPGEVGASGDGPSGAGL